MKGRAAGGGAGGPSKPEKPQSAPLGNRRRDFVRGGRSTSGRLTTPGHWENDRGTL
jgi:hypothetical protein